MTRKWWACQSDVRDEQTSSDELQTSFTLLASLVLGVFLAGDPWET